MDSKASTPFSQALRISKMAAEMLRQASCHFICLRGVGGENNHHGGVWDGLRERVMPAPTTTLGAGTRPLTPASSPRSC